MKPAAMRMLAKATAKATSAVRRLVICWVAGTPTGLTRTSKRCNCCFFFQDRLPKPHPRTCTKLQVTTVYARVHERSPALGCRGGRRRGRAREGRGQKRFLHPAAAFRQQVGFLASPSPPQLGCSGSTGVSVLFPVHGINEKHVGECAFYCKVEQELGYARSHPLSSPTAGVSQRALFEHVALRQDSDFGAVSLYAGFLDITDEAWTAANLSDDGEMLGCFLPIVCWSSMTKRLKLKPDERKDNVLFLQFEYCCR